MQPFDLERFKAGEPAYHHFKIEKTKCFYLGELPDGKIVVKYKDDTEWFTHSHSLDYMNNNYFMKERELTWDDVYEMWETAEMDSRTHSPLYKWLEGNFEPPKLKNNGTN
jgi:hypothetical protein